MHIFAIMAEWIIIVLATGLSVKASNEMSASTQIDRLNPWIHLAGLVVLLSIFWVPCLLAWLFFGKAELGILGYFAMIVLAPIPLWNSAMDFLYLRIKAALIRARA